MFTPIGGFDDSNLLNTQLYLVSCGWLDPSRSYIVGLRVDGCYPKPQMWDAWTYIDRYFVLARGLITLSHLEDNFIKLGPIKNNKFNVQKYEYYFFKVWISELIQF